MSTPILVRALREDWEYVCEGAQHVLFRHIGQEEKTLCPQTQSAYMQIYVGDHDHDHGVFPLSRDKLLRLSKQVFTDTSSCTHMGYLHDRWEQLVLQRLSPYAEKPVVVALPMSFALDLRVDTLKRNVVPNTRLSGWELSSFPGHHVENTLEQLMRATLIPDYRLSSLSGSVCDSYGLAIEIKPKAGFITKSPLVHPNHRRIKWSCTRYEIVQRLKSNSCPHSKDVSYDPLIFFSQVTTQTNVKTLASTIHQLIGLPNNKLKIWHKDTLIPIKPFVANDSVTYNSLMDMLHNNTSLFECLLSSILLAESIFFRRLLDLQTLDVLDADGAILVYERLLHLCNDDHKQAQNIVDKDESITFNERCDETSFTSNHLIQCSPYQFPKGSTHLSTLLTLIQDFQNNFASNDLELNNDSDLLNTEYEKACSAVDNLNIEECAYLLKNWLLSAAMSDVTFFMRIAPREYNHFDYPEQSTNNNLADISFHILQNQSPTSPGCIIMKGSDKSETWNYRLNVIDWGPKSAKKLQGLRKREELIQFLSL